MKISTHTHSIDLPPPSFPGQIYHVPNQVVGKQVTQIGDDQTMIGVSWGTLAKEEMDAVVEFVRTALLYSGYTCRIEMLGRDFFPMRYISGMETARVRKGGLWSLSLRFEQANLESIPIGVNLIENPNIEIGANGTAQGWSLPHGGTVPRMENVDIYEDFGTRAFQAADTDREREFFMTTEKLPVTDLQTSISCRMNRIAGVRLCRANIRFFDSDGDFITNFNPTSGILAGGGGRFFFGQITGSSPNHTWNRFEVKFGPGISTTIPLAAMFFEVGANIAPVSRTETYVTSLRLADFSVVLTP